MKLTKKAAIVLLSVSVLSACSNDKLMEEVEKTKKKNSEKQELQDQNKEELDKKQKEIIESNEKPIEDVIKESEMDKSKVISDGTNVKIKDNYTDENELAIYVGKVLFEFYTFSQSPEDFYQFLKDYGSPRIHEETVKDKDTGVLIFENVQSIYKQQKIQQESYVLSKVMLSKNKKEGYFYRKIKSNKGDEYYITSLVKENGVWKYSEDSPSPPFEVEEEKVLDENKGE
ncbi:hypothetical protein ACFFIX_20445 [Metabacillus herbersteinensis]|uniref:Lipoprotein n=1 Tax=Metabacillus herbersteinensis TaxID=283816 RepID=A0ABV6GJR8_9BACI